MRIECMLEGGSAEQIVNVGVLKFYYKRTTWWLLVTRPSHPWWGGFHVVINYPPLLSVPPELSSRFAYSSVILYVDLMPTQTKGSQPDAIHE